MKLARFSLKALGLIGAVLLLANLAGCEDAAYKTDPKHTSGSAATYTFITEILDCKIYHLDGPKLPGSMYLAKCADGSASVRNANGKQSTKVVSRQLSEAELKAHWEEQERRAALDKLSERERQLLNINKE